VEQRPIRARLKALFPWNIWVLVTLVGAFAAIGVWAQEKAPRGFTYDTTPVELEVSGHKLRIPQSYLFNYVHGQVKQTSVALLAHIPDLSPISENNVQCFENRMVCDKIVLIVISTLVLPSALQQFQGLFSDSRAATKRGPYGLTQYLDPKLDRKEDIYGRPLGDGDFYWIYCLKQSSPWDDCTY
jgi:hypothetical protein